MSQSSAASLQSADTGLGSCSPPNITPNNTPTTSTVNFGGVPFMHGGPLAATTTTTTGAKLQGVLNQSPPGLIGV